MIVGAVLVGLGVPCPAVAQKQGGTLKIYHRDSPASMSILEEATISTVMPMMGVFNNLVIYDQNVKQNSHGSILPEPPEAHRSPNRCFYRFPVPASAPSWPHHTAPRSG
jgi:peptide/nickel transport system substrate-binding protein